MGIGEPVLSRKLREVVVTNQLHFMAVVTHQPAQAFETRPALSIVVRALAGDGRNRVIVSHQFRPQIVGITNVQQPPPFLRNRHAAMSRRVTKQRDEQQFCRKPR